MPRKVLFYTHAFGGGGAEIVFARLAHAFAGAGDDVLFVADRPGPEGVQDRRNLRHVLLGDNHWRGALRLGTLLRRERPDVSFSALGAQNLKHVAAAAMTGRLGRCVLGFHGFAIAEARFLSRSSFWLAPIITRLTAATICVSDVLLADMRGRWGASRRRTLRIYNPLADTAVHVGAREHPPLIVGCGRLVQGKRFGDLVAAFAALQLPQTRLVILGEGPERTALEAAVQRFGVAGRVELPGHVAEPSQWFARASCLAIASESESFGLTAAEALACGTPVVATDCGGPAEVLDHGRYGRLVPIGDVAALAEALQATLAVPGPDAPRQDRAHTFSLDRVHRDYAALVDRLS